jgi:hypothetical protein
LTNGRDAKGNSDSRRCATRIGRQQIELGDLISGRSAQKKAAGGRLDRSNRGAERQLRETITARTLVVVVARRPRYVPASCGSGSPRRMPVLDSAAMDVG